MKRRYKDGKERNKTIIFEDDCLMQKTANNSQINYYKRVAIRKNQRIKKSCISKHQQEIGRK